MQMAVGEVAPISDRFSPLSTQGQMPLLLRRVLGEIDGGLRATSDLQFLEDIFEVMPTVLSLKFNDTSDFFIGLAFRD